MGNIGRSANIPGLDVMKNALGSTRVEKRLGELPNKKYQIGECPHCSLRQRISGNVNTCKRCGWHN